MIMKKVLFVSGTLLSLGLFSACSNSENDVEVFDDDLICAYNTGEDSSYGEAPDIPHGDINVLHILWDNGNSETCEVYQPHCGSQLIFDAAIDNSSVFTHLHVVIDSNRAKEMNDLQAGDTFDNNEIRFMAFDDRPVNGVISCYGQPDHALGGQIQVVGKLTGADGKSYIILNLQDLKYDDYTLSATIAYEMPANETVYNNDNNNVDQESLSQPSDELMFFMMEALHGDESQGRRTFFSEEPGKEECLIINSAEEFREAYKGNKELPMVNFSYCTLVIGRTYGESGGVSLGDYELTDNGDAYQLNVTLNNNVNPNYAYTCAFVDLYFWKLYPKMEKKPVVFNRIRQDVNLDPFGSDSPYTLIRNRWVLDMYSDADGTSHHVGKELGDYHYATDDRYTIEFMEHGRVEGRINTNEFGCNYMITYTGKRAYYNDIDHGVIHMWDWIVTKVGDDDPLSEKFLRISSATQFQLVSNYSLTLYVSPKEWFCFRREGL